jgi:hypothetical protein
MPAGATFFWNDSWLKAGIAEAYRISVTEAAGVARSRAPWNHIKSSISPTTDGIRVGASDAALAEKGAKAHDIEKSGVTRFANGEFASGKIAHPGFGGTPFMKPAAEAWPTLFNSAARAALPSH